jgi:hypothetical protein
MSEYHSENMAVNTSSFTSQADEEEQKPRHGRSAAVITRHSGHKG